MIREARGSYESEGGLTAAPRVRMGVGFGRDRVVATSALVDTGSDLCVVPREIVPWPLPDGPAMRILVQGVGGASFRAEAVFPSVTVGNIRRSGVATVVLPGAEPILGRSFLNACDLRLSAERSAVVLRHAGPSRG